MSQDLPVLYSFRRCPYAIRARLALAASGLTVELREVSLKDKHPSFIATSESATVPCLQHADGVIDESLDIMNWALNQSDPMGWLDMPAAGWDLIERFDGPFKKALDRTKYAVRHPEVDPVEQRDVAHQFLSELDAMMGDWIFGSQSLADFAILPFVRQFAFIDKPVFDAQPWPHLHAWLARFLDSEQFQNVMDKRAFWQTGDAPVLFP